MSATTPSSTASKSPSFDAKWWYSAPLATPAVSSTAAIDVRSYPSWPKCWRAAATNRSRVARPRSTRASARAPDGWASITAAQ